jgi:hypothetical protein
VGKGRREKETFIYGDQMTNEARILKLMDEVCKRTLPKISRTNLGSLSSITQKKKLKFRSILK